MITFTITLGQDRGKVYERFTYPAGETQVRLLPERIEEIRQAEQVNIIARIRGAEDIIEVAMLCNAIRNLGTGVYMVLVLPYMAYSRADRKFTDGDCFGLDVFNSFMKIFDVDRVVTLDIHSEAGKEILADSWFMDVVNVSPEPFIERAIAEFAAANHTKEIVVLFPDKGASERYAIADRVGCNTDVVDVRVMYAMKIRNPVTGKFEEFTVPEGFGDRPILIVDDICDGGGTFVGIGKLLPEQVWEGKLGLYVTHGIFSKGTGELGKYFKYIYMTNTFVPQGEYDGTYDSVRVFDAIPMLLKEANG